MRMFFCKRARFTRRFLSIPDEPTFVYLAMLRQSPLEEEAVARMLAANCVLLERTYELGGTLYPFSAVPLSKDEWRRHYGAASPALVQAKKRFDPDGVLASGPDLEL